MSFFKKLFPIKKEERAFIHRATRVDKAYLKNIKFKVQIDSQWVGFYISNLSQSGIAFLSDSFKDHFKTAQVYQAQIECGDKKEDFSFEVARINSDLIGAKVVDNNIDYGILVTRYLKVEIAALQVSVINSEKLAKDPDGKPTWMVGQDSCELFYVVNEDQGLVKYNISIFGNVIERDKDKKFHFKEIWADDQKEMAYKGSDLLRDVPSDFPVAELLENALSFVQTLKNLEENIQQLILSELKLTLKTL